MFKARIAQLMDKEMDRKTFLVHVAAGAVAVTGATAMFRSLLSAQTQKEKSGRDYGISAYGR